MVVNHYFAFKCAYSTTKEVARAKTTGGGGGGTSRCTNSPKQPTSTAPPPTPASHPRPLMHHAASFCALKTLAPPGTKDMSFGLIHLRRAGILLGFCALGGDRWDLKADYLGRALPQAPEGPPVWKIGNLLKLCMAEVTCCAYLALEVRCTWDYVLCTAMVSSRTLSSPSSFF